MKHYLLILFSCYALTDVAQAQHWEEKSTFYSIVDNPNNTWVFNSKTIINLPTEIEDFNNKLFEDVAQGKDSLKLLHIHNKIVSGDNFKDYLGSVDSVLTYNPISLDTDLVIVASAYPLVENRIGLNEIWYYDTELNQLRSSIVSSFFHFINFPNEEFKGIYSGYFKKNEMVENKDTTFLIDRVLYFDSFTVHNDTNYEKGMPIKILYNEDLGRKIWNNLFRSEHIVRDGPKLNQPKDAIRYWKTTTRLNPITLQMGEVTYGYEINPKKIKYYKIQEEWTVDLISYSIEKKIISLSPVLQNTMDPRSNEFNTEEFTPFTIIYD